MNPAQYVLTNGKYAKLFFPKDGSLLAEPHSSGFVTLKRRQWLIVYLFSFSGAFSCLLSAGRFHTCAAQVQKTWEYFMWHHLSMDSNLHVDIQQNTFYGLQLKRILMKTMTCSWKFLKRIKSKPWVCFVNLFCFFVCQTRVFTIKNQSWPTTLMKPQSPLQ